MLKFTVMQVFGKNAQIYGDVKVAGSEKARDFLELVRNIKSNNSSHTYTSNYKG